MKELKHYLKRSLTTSGPPNLFLMNKRGKTDKSTSQQQFPIINTELSRMKRSVELLSRETTRIDFKFQTASSLTVYMFEWFSQQATLTFLHPYFAMSKLKYSMQDRQKPFSEFQQTTAVETFGQLSLQIFLKVLFIFNMIYVHWICFQTRQW